MTKNLKLEDSTEGKKQIKETTEQEHFAKKKKYEGRGPGVHTIGANISFMQKR